MAQAFPQRPQWRTSLEVATSHPLAALPSQSPKSASHAIPHAPIEHTGRAFARRAQTFPHAPHWSGADDVSTHDEPQRVWPAAHPLEHAKAPRSPATQRGVDPAQALPHAPQFAVPESAASQPFEATPSQSAKPERHAMRHVPAVQTGAALGAAAQVVPHAPQCAVLTRVSTSHPLAAMPSQLP